MRGERAGSNSDTGRARNDRLRGLVLRRSGMRIEVLAWRSPWVLFIEMVEDPSDDLGLDEGNDDKLVTAGTEEWVGLVNPPAFWFKRFFSF